MISEYRRQIFGYECDVYGHLNNANYLHIFEEARSQLLVKTGYSIPNLQAQGVEIFAISINIDYIKQVSNSEAIIVSSRIEKINRLRSTWNQTLLDSSGNICAKFKLQTVFAQNGKAKRMEKELFKDFKKKLLSKG